MAVFYSFLAFVAVFLLVGTVSARASLHSPEDYLLASRQVSPMFVGVSGTASTVSGFAFTGLVAFIYLNGYSGGWFSLGMIFGSLTGFALASRRLRTRGQRRGAASYPEYLSARMDGRTRLFGRVTGLLAMLLALGETGSIFELVTYAGAIMAAGFAPLLFIAAMGWRIHQGTALAMIVVAVATASWWRFMGYHQYVFDALPGIATAFAVYTVGSRVSRLQRRDGSRNLGVSRPESRATGKPAAPVARPGRSEK